MAGDRREVRSGNTTWMTLHERPPLLEILNMQAEARGDPTQPCAVCQETFERGGEQVILSCSHMFHRACIASFERFLRTQRRTCPLCRKANYEKRVTDSGTRACMGRAAVLVQGLVRGWLARRHFRQRLKAYYAKGLGDPRVRRRFALRELSRYTETVTRAVEEDEESLTCLFAECADALAISRQVFRQPEPQLDRHRPDAGTPPPLPSGEIGGDKWAQAVAQAQARGDRDCPICMGEMVNGVSAGKGGGTGMHGGLSECGDRGVGDGADTEPEGSRTLSILNCSHVFHESCISAFEQFNIYEVQLCPVCRASYERAPF